MGNEIRNLAIVLAIFGFGWWLLNRQAQAQEQELPTPSTSTSPLVSATNLDKKFNLSKCDAVVGKATRTKGECIQVGSKHGVVITYSDGKRCTVKCSSIATWTPQLKKQLGIDKCKCNAVDRADLEAELVKSSYTSFRVTIA